MQEQIDDLDGEVSDTENTISHIECLLERSKEVEGVATEVRRWIFHWDTNCDQLITISDVSYWAHYLFFVPGDAVLYGIFSIKWLSVFFETGPTDVYGGILSGILSMVVWLGVIAATIDCMSDLFRAVRRHSES